LEIFDPRPYWDEAGDGYRKIVGPRISVGCLYKTKSKCSYCSWSSKYRIGSTQSFWNATEAQINWALSIPWTGKKEVRAYQIGADLGSDNKFIKQLWSCRPSWSSSVIRHRIYSHAVSDETASKLYDIGMRYIFIGADGKPGYSYEWNSPLVTNLETCRKHGLIVGVGFVIGKRGENWQDLNKWKSFRDRLVKEFKGTIVACYGWINLVMPGSADWETMTCDFPEIKNSDYQDLLELREKFLYKYTFLKSSNIVEKLEKTAKEFDYNG
jgi:hypothetical protein